MADKTDIYKIAVSVALIHIIIIIIMEGVLVTSNPSDAMVLNALTNVFSDVGIANQVETTGLCTVGMNSQTACEGNGCVWDNGQCFTAMQKKGSIDLGIITDVFYGLYNVAVYSAKFLWFIATASLYGLVLEIKLLPMIENYVIRGLVGLIILIYQMVIIYYQWAFLSNWRGINQR